MRPDDVQMFDTGECDDGDVAASDGTSQDDVALPAWRGGIIEDHPVILALAVKRERTLDTIQRVPDRHEGIGTAGMDRGWGARVGAGNREVVAAAAAVQIEVAKFEYNSDESSLVKYG